MEQILQFNNREEFRRWLEINHNQTESIWIEFKKTMLRDFGPEEALEEALCFGWIDSIIKRVDELRYIKKFSKRREKSNWSEKNKKTVERLIELGKMSQVGMKSIEIARKNGQWESQKKLVTPEMIELLKENLKIDERACGMFEKLNTSSQLILTGFYFEVKKDDARNRRLLKIMDCLLNNRPMIDLTRKL